MVYWMWSLKSLYFVEILDILFGDLVNHTNLFTSVVNIVNMKWGSWTAVVVVGFIGYRERNRASWRAGDDEIPYAPQVKGKETSPGNFKKINSKFFYI